MKQKILFVLCLLLGLFMLNAGLNKFFEYMPMPDNMPQEMKDDFAAFSEICWLMPLVAFAEIIGGILFVFRKTRAFGAVILFPVMVGILLTNILVDQSGLPIALACCAVLAWAMYENRSRYMPMIK